MHLWELREWGNHIFTFSHNTKDNDVYVEYSVVWRFIFRL